MAGSIDWDGNRVEIKQRIARSESFSRRRVVNLQRSAVRLCVLDSQVDPTTQDSSLVRQGFPCLSMKIPWVIIMRIQFILYTSCKSQWNPESEVKVRIVFLELVAVRGYLLRALSRWGNLSAIGMVLSQSLMAAPAPVKSESVPLPEQQLVELVTVTLTTPSRETFTVSAPAETLVSIRDNSTGEEFAYFVGVAEFESAWRLAEETVEMHSIAFYEVHDGGLVKYVSGVSGLLLEKEFLEPSTGIIFRVVDGHASRLRRDGGVPIAACCVDCGAYTICGGRVSACGRTCFNYELETPLKSETDPLNFTH